MDYEKAYNEAIKRAKAAIDIAADKDLVKGVATTIFPELSESEDERVRKWIYNLIGSLGDPQDEDAEKELEEMQPLALAYLEKQKEQKVDIDKLRRDIYQSGYNDGYQHGKEDAQKEQKPAIKLVFPRFRIGDIICNVHDECDKTTKRISYVDEHGYNFDYKHLGDKAGGGSFGFCYEDYYELVEQKPAWSEEDERNIDTLVSVIREHYTDCDLVRDDYPINARGLVAWLKSLRPDSYKNCNSQWKPSAEQMEVDLEKEIIRYQREDMDRDTTVGDVARHFYELGLNARKEE